MMMGVSETLVQTSRIIRTNFTSNGRRQVYKCSRVVPAEQIRKHLPESQDSVPLHPTRRIAALSLAVVTLTGQLDASRLLAEEEKLRFWLDGPLDTLPPVSSKINNEAGTRSFLKQGVFRSKTGPKGSAYRLKKSAFDLLGMADMIERDTWSYIIRFLRLKSTLMYYDFDNVIVAAPDDQKEGLTDLANGLFDNVEKLQDAVKSRNVLKTRSCYKETSNILEEVMVRMAPETLQRDLLLLDR